MRAGMGNGAGESISTGPMNAWIEELTKPRSPKEAGVPVVNGRVRSHGSVHDNSRLTPRSGSLFF
jgi:hypothetical protein